MGLYFFLIFSQYHLISPSNQSALLKPKDIAKQQKLLDKSRGHDKPLLEDPKKMFKLLMVCVTPLVIWYFILPTRSSTDDYQVHPAEHAARVMEAREVFKSGKTADELARERMLDDVALSNKIGQIAFQKRAEKYEKQFGVPVEAPALVEEEDTRSLVEIKEAVSRKAGEDATWVKIQTEIDEGVKRA